MTFGPPDHNTPALPQVSRTARTFFVLFVSFVVHLLRSPMKTITRRRFNQSVLAASSALAAPAFLRGQNLNDKLNIAVIACGGRGGSNLASVSSQNIVALCDVNNKN